MRPLARVFDGAALRDNWCAVRRRVHARNIFAVVKSRAYGHGLCNVAAALRDLADGFGVVEMADAAALRAAGVKNPILMMNGTFDDDDAAAAISLNLWTAVRDDLQLRRVLAAPAGANLCVFVKVNGDMNRLGFSFSDAAAAMDALARSPAVAQVALMTHFARADEENGIAAVSARLSPLRQKADFVSFGNSAASLLHGDIGDDWARIGIALYGASPAPERICRDELGLRAVMILKTLLVQTRMVRAGESVGYGGIWRAPRDSRIGIAAVGYGDGYPRAQNLWAIVGGIRAPVVGRVSMELTALDISECPDAAVGAEVVLWGDSPSVDDAAIAAGRISYELLTAAGRDCVAKKRARCGVR